MRVNVPFAFHNGSQRMPAGVYTVSIESAHLILLRGHSRSSIVSTNPEIGKPSAKGKLVFQRYGDRYFLREVWAANSEAGQKCVKSKLEREIEIAQSTATQPGAELALNSYRGDRKAYPAQKNGRVCVSVVYPGTIGEQVLTADLVSVSVLCAVDKRSVQATQVCS